MGRIAVRLLKLRTAGHIIGYGLLLLVCGVVALFAREGYANCLIAAVRDYDHGAALVVTRSRLGRHPHVVSTRDYLTCRVFTPCVAKRRLAWWHVPRLYRGTISTDRLR